MQGSDQDPSATLLWKVRNGDIDEVRELIKRYGISHRPEWSNGYNLLRDALSNGHIEVAKLLLANGCKVYSKRSLSVPTFTALHYAVMFANLEVVKVLLQRGAYVNAINNNGDTPLHNAVLRNEVDIVALLVEYGACVNTRDKDGEMPLHIALKRRDIEIAMHLLKHRADVNAGICASNSKEGYTPLHISARNGEEEIVKILLSKGASVNVTAHGITPLHIAAEKGHSGITEKLLKHGADVNCVGTLDFTESNISIDLETEATCKEAIMEYILSDDASDNSEWKGNTPFNIVIAKAQIVDILIQHAKEEMCYSPPKFSEGSTPLHLAVRNGHERVARTLLECGANVDAQDNTGKTALLLAVENKDSIMVDLILEHFPNLSNESNKRSLIAAIYGSVKCFKGITKSLLQYGFNVSLENVNDSELLLNAVEKGYASIVESLLKLGADANQLHEPTSMNNSCSALHVAVMNKQEEVAQILVKHHVDVNAHVSEGKPPIIDAVKNADSKMIQLLLSSGASVPSDSLFIAIKNNSTGIDEVLSDYAPDHHLRDQSRRISIIAKDLKCHADDDCAKEEVVKLLLRNGADVNSQSNFSCLSIHAAAFYGYVRVLETLLKHGADSNSKSKSGVTPLHLAAYEGHLEVIEKLLEFGAFVDSTDDFGRTALHIASDEGHVLPVIVLLLNGSDVNIISGDKQTPLDFATRGESAFYKNVRAHDPEEEQYFDSHYGICSHQVVKTILKDHISKMKAANLYINPKLLASTHPCEWGNLQDMDSQNEFLDELESLKCTFVGNTKHSLYDILTKNIHYLSILLEDENVTHYASSNNLKEKFPIYASIIHSHFAMAKQRKNILQKVNDCALRIFPALTRDCIQKVLTYLSNGDLMNLIQANTSKPLQDVSTNS